MVETPGLKTLENKREKSYHSVETQLHPYQIVEQPSVFPFGKHETARARAPVPSRLHFPARRMNISTGGLIP